MTISELLDAAKRNAGTFGTLADALGCHQNRFSEWRKGTRKPDASEIAFLAAQAGLPVLQTVADIEAQINSKYAHVWREALGKLTAAGVTAGLVLVPALMPENAHADSQQEAHSTYYVN